MKMSKYGAFSGPYFPYSGRIRENMDQKKLRIWTIFTWWWNITKKNQIDARRKAYIIINHNEYKKKIEMFIFVLRGLSLCFNNVQKKFLKFFVSYKINEKITPLCVLLRKISGFLK